MDLNHKDNVLRVETPKIISTIYEITTLRRPAQNTITKYCISSNNQGIIRK